MTSTPFSGTYYKGPLSLPVGFSFDDNLVTWTQTNGMHQKYAEYRYFSLSSDSRVWNIAAQDIVATLRQEFVNDYAIFPVTSNHGRRAVIGQVGGIPWGLPGTALIRKKDGSSEETIIQRYMDMFQYMGFAQGNYIQQNTKDKSNSATGINIETFGFGTIICDKTDEDLSPGADVCMWLAPRKNDFNRLTTAIEVNRQGFTVREIRHVAADKQMRDCIREFLDNVLVREQSNDRQTELKGSFYELSTLSPTCTVTSKNIRWGHSFSFGILGFCLQFLHQMIHHGYLQGKTAADEIKLVTNPGAAQPEWKKSSSAFVEKSSEFFGLKHTANGEIHPHFEAARQLLSRTIAPEVNDQLSEEPYFENAINNSLYFTAHGIAEMHTSKTKRIGHVYFVEPADANAPNNGRLKITGLFKV